MFSPMAAGRAGRRPVNSFPTSASWGGRSASVCATGGSRALLGTVRIRDVTKGTPDDIWERFGSAICCTREEFDSYVGDRTYLYAVHLADPRPYETPVPLSQLS